MLRMLTRALAMSVALSGAAWAETHEVQMLNKGDAGRMIFEPAFLQVATGDTIKFIAASKGHNAESVEDMLPEGAAEFKGKVNEEIEVTLDVDGLYGIKCKPHYAMGMVMTIAVGENTEIPASFFEGRIPKKAMKRFVEQTSGL